ncbi:Tat pathway signal protein [Rhodoferax saidenbachensis]|uniref:Tat pathway signal protein n=1 Tax=Rhodoferax saidenbachensis TaxID=1484693 RepID=A0A1P8KG81_9BURK|nr:Tat pathway signal protein [Rhodoferax saidenbachensis]
MSRRQFTLSAPALLAGTPLMSACSPDANATSYEDLVAATWRPAAVTGVNGDALHRELVRYATLAPSSHNTQCWKFRLAQQTITVVPDVSRRCPAVDPDDHHLWVSLGCATENLAQAALAHGQLADARYDTAQQAVQITLAPTRAQASALFQAIPSRQCTRGDYDGKPLSTTDLDLLQRAGTANGVRMLLLTERPAMENVLDFVVQANTAQMASTDFMKELKTWIRFNGTEAVRTRDGLFSLTSDNPTIPTWLGELAFGMFFKPQGENDKYTRQIRSSAGIAVFVSDVADKAHWVEVGRCYERFALQATALGIRNAFLNQPVEVSSVRPSFSAALGLGDLRPDLVVRFGRGPTMPSSLRRPVQAVLL